MDPRVNKLYKIYICHHIEKTRLIDWIICSIWVL